MSRRPSPEEVRFLVGRAQHTAEMEGAGRLSPAELAAYFRIEAGPDGQTAPGITEADIRNAL